MKSLFAAIAVTFAVTCSAVAAEWHGFARDEFVVAGKPCFITRPKIAAAGGPWVWRTSFPDFNTDMDLEVLQNGWAIAFIDCVSMLGSDEALDAMDAFYDEVTANRGLGGKPALEAVSRGGLHAYRYASRRPERIACIYAESPALDLKSWPLGAGAKAETADALRYYGFADEAALRAYRGNPVDVLAPIAQAKIPLRHVISLNDTVVPPEQNTLEAARRLEALGHSMDVVRVAEGTPQSKGHHFALPEAFQSARFIMQHSTVLPDAKEYFNVRGGLCNAFEKFTNAKEGRVAFLGGSITYNPGWRDAVMRYLKLRFPDTKFDFIASGIPSLGSVPHSFRLQADVLSRGPVDLLFVEAAVNDHNHEGDPRAERLVLRGMEGVVRHARMANPSCDVVLMQFIHDYHFKTYAAGNTPYTVAQHERVAEHYRCPSVNLSREVNDRIAAKQFTWADDFKNLHPSPYGQQIYAASITRMLDACCTTSMGPPGPHPLPAPLDPSSFTDGRFGDIATATLTGGATLVPEWKPTDGKPTRGGYVDVPAIVAAAPGDGFEFPFTGTVCGLMITSGPDAGMIEFSVDGGEWKSMSSRSAWSNGLHLPWALILDDSLPPGPHTARVRVVDGALRVFRLLINGP